MLGCLLVRECLLPTLIPLYDMAVTRSQAKRNKAQNKTLRRRALKDCLIQLIVETKRCKMLYPHRGDLCEMSQSELLLQLELGIRELKDLIRALKKANVGAIRPM